jgi:hypothetical protein
VIVGIGMVGVGRPCVLVTVIVRPPPPGCGGPELVLLFVIVTVGLGGVYTYGCTPLLGQTTIVAPFCAISGPA